jgi:hypothetical protein
LNLGQELAYSLKDTNAVVTAYQKVIDQYNFTYLDFNIEGDAFKDSSSIDIRNEALVRIRQNNPRIKISYSIPVLTTGLTSDGLYLLQSVKKYGLTVDRIGI